MCESVSLWAFLVKFPSDTKHRIFAWPCIKHSIKVICVIRNHYLRYENALTPKPCNSAVHRHVFRVLLLPPPPPPSNEVHMNFSRISYEMKSNSFICNSREVHKLHMEFKWTSYEFHFICNEIKVIHMNLHAVRMKLIWSSYRKTNEVNMLYPCNANEVYMRLINSSHEIHMKFIWILNDLNFMWTSCEIHKNYMKNTHEYGF